MSADVLREAARLMRERADAAVPGVWSADGSGEVVSGLRPPPADDHLSSYAFDAPVCSVDDYDGEDLALDTSEHIASWHPGVALAVAEWLDSLAAAMTDPAAPGGSVSTDREEKRALAVARAYLGAEATP